ncbi:hypothetical protein Tco_0745255 [Tanacetum coccineum]
MFTTPTMRIGSSFPSVIGFAFTLLASVGVMAVILVEFIVLDVSLDLDNILGGLVNMFPTSFVVMISLGLFVRFLHDSWGRLLIRVVPVPPFSIFLSGAFPWSPLLGFFSCVTIHESDWKLYGHKFYERLYFDSMYEAYYSLVFIVPGDLGRFIFVLGYKGSDTFTVFSSYAVDCLALGFREHLGIPLETGFSSAFLFLVSERLTAEVMFEIGFMGVVSCGLPSASLSSPLMDTFADIMSVGDEGVVSVSITMML